VRVLQKIETRVAAASTRVIVPSEYLKYIVSCWGIPQEKISVVYNAVPFEALGIVPTSVAQLARPRIVSVGRLVPWKGFNGVIDAVAALHEQGTDASLVIVGDGPERVELTTYARAALGAQGVYFTGQLSHGETLAIIKSADVLALNSSYEGLSHLLIEALSLGAPVVATRVGGNGEVITDEENGLLIPFGDSSHLAGALKRIIEDSALRERLGKRARESSIRFAEETMVAKTVELFKKL
jgi:glycosyltransferase involved in cell wall biosynthesis